MAQVKLWGSRRNVPKGASCKALYGLYLVAFLLVFCGGCRKQAVSARLSDAEFLTRETLLQVLLGDPVQAGSLHQTGEKGLLQTGKYERVIVAADADGFARMSRGSVGAQTIRDMENRVVADVDKRLRKEGFEAAPTSYPVGTRLAVPRTLFAIITPHIEAVGSPQERSQNKHAALILVRLTVSDARTGNILACRDFYSGADVRHKPQQASFPDSAPPKSNNTGIMP
jgi:hypothetical protein